MCTDFLSTITPWPPRPFLVGVNDIKVVYIGIHQRKVQIEKWVFHALMLTLAPSRKAFVVHGSLPSWNLGANICLCMHWFWAHWSISLACFEIFPQRFEVVPISICFPHQVKTHPIISKYALSCPPRSEKNQIPLRLLSKRISGRFGRRRYRLCRKFDGYL